MRQKRPASDPIPAGHCIDARYPRKHFLSPTQQMVKRYLSSPTDRAWARFETEYVAALQERHQKDPRPFEDLARMAKQEDVSIGCTCPTKTNPRVDRCHTVLALRFMKQMYPRLRVVIPKQ